MARSSQYSPTGAGTRIYSERTVLQAAYDRIEWLFGEFDNVVVRVSGGKDSTVIYWIALEVARHLGRLPLKVYWLDQEAEWQSTVDIVGDWMRHPDVDPIWLQVPFRIFNAASQTDHWLYAWDPAAEGKWVHEPDPLARRENVYGTDRFVELFGAASAHEFGGRKACSITGVRAQESPNRRKGLTSFKTYKWATWGGKEPDWPDNYQFHPLYDWTFVDVWKCILDHGWEYNRLYDTQFTASSICRSSSRRPMSGWPPASKASTPPGSWASTTTSCPRCRSCSTAGATTATTCWFTWSIRSTGRAWRKP
jgi:predicted phosphoadenosine phosphosulfate sulfurtransferase